MQNRGLSKLLLLVEWIRDLRNASRKVLSPGSFFNADDLLDFNGQRAALVGSDYSPIF